MAPINNEAKEIQLHHLAEREPIYLFIYLFKSLFTVGINDIVEKMYLIDVANKFVSLHPPRLNIFGKFTDKDLS